MSAVIFLFVIAGLVGIEVIWGVWMLFTGRTDRKPPRHVEHTWTVDDLPNRPYAGVR